FTNYQEGTKAWATVENYVIVINPSIPGVPELQAFPRPYLVVAFESVIHNVMEGKSLQDCVPLAGETSIDKFGKRPKKNRSLSEFFT
ncbi:MAG TPA: hypothetical protein VKK79_01240, partial [Candidatus Lokiarchaeia archaeon]|nr:hypothetical protein [Candidatus Lokiarchaeia archaeon]